MEARPGIRSPFLEFPTGVALIGHIIWTRERLQQIVCWQIPSISITRGMAFTRLQTAAPHGRKSTAEIFPRILATMRNSNLFPEKPAISFLLQGHKVVRSQMVWAFIGRRIREPLGLQLPMCRM